ncbi:chitobiase/beta-hexosaminidase C-terminal domain-containing protein [Methanosphaera sp.]
MKYNKLSLFFIVLILTIVSVNATEINDNTTIVNNSNPIIQNDLPENEFNEVYTNIYKEIDNNQEINNNYIYNDTNEIIDDTILLDHDNQILINNMPESYIDLNNENSQQNIITKTKSSTSNLNITYSYNDILKAANQTSNYIKTNHTLPATATLNGKQVNMNDFLYLICKSLNQTTQVTSTTYNHVTGSYGTNSDNTKIYKEKYLILANEIIKCYNTNGRNPKKIATVDYQTMSFDDTVYFYARAVAFKYNNNRLPNYGTIIALYNNDYSQETEAQIKNTTAPVYITNKPQLNSNGHDYTLNLTTSKQNKIYYTINGTIPTQKSTQYTKPITINNYTILQFFSITPENKTSPIYYYKNENPTPYVTIINNTEVENNYQTIKLIANKPGIIYYTRNGTIPTNQSKPYNQNSELNISIKTQINTILEDKQTQKSENNVYQAPQIITLPVVKIEVITQLPYNKMKIYFDLKKTQKVYYTTDGTNPKNSSSMKKMNYEDQFDSGTIKQQIELSSENIVKYYTEDELGLKTNTYTFKPKKQNERVTITILNTTPLYTKGAVNTKGEEKIKIQVNDIEQLVIRKDEEFIENNEIVLNQTNKIIIKVYGERRINEYSLQNGLRTRMNYTYTMKIPYQKMSIVTNNKIIMNLTNNTLENELKNGKYLLYDYNTKTNKLTSETNLTNPGILINISNNTIIIKTYDYCYGDTNQLSITKEWVKYNTLNINTINNGVKKEIGTFYMPSLNYIDCEFISNDFYRSDNIRDYLSSTKINNTRTLESVHTYVLTNQKISYDVLQTWIQKYHTYNKSVYKSCYGTFMTGLTHMYFENAMMTVIDYELNLSTYAAYNTQMDVYITSNGQTVININDGSYGTIARYSDSTNFKIHNFLNGYIGSYLEDLVLYMTGDNNTGSACTYFIQDVLNYKTINFTYDNNTGKLKIHTQDNTDYMITINPSGSYTWSILNHRTDSKTLKSTTNTNLTENETNIELELTGGLGTPGYEYTYETGANEIILDALSSLDNILNWTMNHVNYSELNWEIINTGEDMAGSILIGTGICLICATGVGTIPIALIAGGSALCFFATGVNEVEDLSNPYYYIKSSWSISEAVVTSYVGGPLTKEFAKITATTITKTIDKKVISASIHETLVRNNLEKSSQIPNLCYDLINNKFKDMGLDFVLKHTKGYISS